MLILTAIQKSGELTEKSIKKFNIDKLYLYCGFRNNKNFLNIHIFEVNNFFYHVYGKNTGKSNIINKFELPPPIDKNLYYGNIIIIKANSETLDTTSVLDCPSNEWENVYETLMGGFEDIQEESSQETDELDNYSDTEKTTSGYLKDGFIVDDSELSEEDYESE